ncbi:CaiB/BaiF CoA transferase family protein [Ideonella margarita]|uniref:CaiB/BaiF CoA-transferase family protein n=1 Tax=Ideonella margarita TaxID=2984191 RepID=A0ABU9C1J6_9BURK
MGPLQGLRVIELASIGPGPLCAMLLADQGADVVRIDRLQPSGLGLDLDETQDIAARGRRSVALDLKHPDGLAAALALVAGADVLIEGWRPGVAEKLGLGPADCHALNPGLIYGRMTGFGQTGPLAAAAGHDINYIALTGALHAIGTAQPGSPPVPPLNLVGDYGGGALYLAFGVMAALFERQRSGRGQVVDAAMVDGAASLMTLFHGLAAGGGWNTAQRASNLLDGGAPFYGCYATSDERWVSIGPLEPKFFAQLAGLIGLPAHFVSGQYDRETWPAMRAALSSIFASRTRDAWCALLEGTDACFAPVLDLHEATGHAHAEARGAYLTINGLRQPAPAPRFGRSVAEVPSPPPQLGQHTHSVLREAGLSDDHIARLLASGAARQNPAP